MLQCPAGELSTRVEKRTAKNGNTYLRYIFSKVTCRKCPQREKCRVGRSNAKTRSYSITQASEKNLERLKFEESEYFQERMKIRHRIEEKNGELKEAHGLRKADSRGLFAMHLQMYFTAFTANVKRIVRLEELGDVKNSIEFFRIPLFAFVVYKLLESYAEKAHFPYPIEILFLNLCGSSISHLFVALPVLSNHQEIAFLLLYETNVLHFS